MFFIRSFRSSLKKKIMFKCWRCKMCTRFKPIDSSFSSQFSLTLRFPRLFLQHFLLADFFCNGLNKVLRWVLTFVSCSTGNLVLCFKDIRSKWLVHCCCFFFYWVPFLCFSFWISFSASHFLSISWISFANWGIRAAIQIESSFSFFCTLHLKFPQKTRNLPVGAYLLWPIHIHSSIRSQSQHTQRSIVFVGESVYFFLSVFVVLLNEYISSSLNETKRTRTERTKIQNQVETHKF